MDSNSSQPANSGRSRRTNKRPDIDSNTLEEVERFRRAFLEMRAYFRYDAGYQTIAASDLNSYDKTIRDFTKALDGWTERGICNKLFNSIETLNLKLDEVRNLIFRAQGLLPSSIPPEKQAKKRPPKDSVVLADVYSTLPKVIDAILQKFK